MKGVAHPFSALGLTPAATPGDPAASVTAGATRRAALKAMSSAVAVAGVSGALMMSRSGLAARVRFTRKLGLALAPSHPTTIGLVAACAEIHRQSGGRLAIDVFPSSQLGSDIDMISQVRSGGTDFVCTAASIWGGLVPVASISCLGYAFPNHDAAWSAMDGALGAHIRTEFSKFDLVPQTKIWHHGFRHVTTSLRPINSPKDLAGLKIRVPVSPVMTALFKAFDAAPTPVDIAETYTALQTKIVDGQENPLAVVESQRFYEVQKFCSLTSHVWDGFWLVANRRSWTALPEELRQIASSVFDARAILQRQELEAMNTQLRIDLASRGMTVNAPDIARFRASLRNTSFYGESQKRFGPEAWAKLEKYTGNLA